MPNGGMPDYNYRPAVSGVDPKIKTRSSRRGRLFAGGTYFRAREPGGTGNNISIELIEYTSEVPGEEGLQKATLVVTNHNTLYTENLIGPVDIQSLEQQLKWNEFIKIVNLTTTPSAQNYSISLQIAPPESVQENLGAFSFSSLFYVKSKLSVKLTPRTAEITALSEIVIKPRTRMYDLVTVSKTTEPTDGSSPVTTSGWGIEPLRALVNANDPWIEMMERSGTPLGTDTEPGVPLEVKFDYQDDGIDDDFASAFSDTYLSGGDGLPLVPSAERTGPTRSLVHINYGETYNGQLAVANTVYEWAGDTASAGEWKTF